jgi:G3E family GTPase
MSTSSPECSSEARLPVTVITGFLGSGKTTLIKHILTNQQGLRTAVIVNELSEIGIDSDLIVSADNMVELENGCICCSINNDFLDAIFRILNRDRRVDYLVVETSGVSDPLPVVLTFLRSELRDRVRVDSIITVADAASFCLEQFESKAARNQLCHGDVILLNKCDLVGAERLQTLEDTIRTLKPRARIVRTTQCRVALPLVLSVGLFQSDRFFADPGPAQGCDQGLDSNHDSSNCTPTTNMPPTIWRRTVSRPFRFKANGPLPRNDFRTSSSGFPIAFIAARASFGSAKVTNATFFISWPSVSPWMKSPWMKTDAKAKRGTSSC